MKSLLLNADAVFFDFDGVIADSHDVKTRAFAALYTDEHPEIIDAVIAYHNANAGISRYRKFEHFERVLLGLELTPERMAVLSGRFATAVVDAVVASPEVPGAGALLDALKRREKPCHVASGTPEEELQNIVRRRQLESYFTCVRGSPTEKGQILAEVSSEHGHDPARCVMIGDAMADFSAARSLDMPFLGVVQKNSRTPFPPGTRVVADFWSLAEEIG